MILAKRAALGGVQLDELHESIVIQKIDPGTPQRTINAVAMMGGAGQRITGKHWETLDVVIEFGINLPKREMELRRQVFEMVTAWALRGGWLTVGWMPGRRMWVDHVELPSSGDLWDWTASYTITFRAYSVPFWQDEMPVLASHQLITSGSVSIEVGGNAQSVLDISFQNRSGMTINNFRVSAGGNTLILSSLGLGGSETLSISHGTDGLLRITAGGRSVLDRRTGSDDLYVMPGSNTVTVQADRAGALTVRSYGRYV
jgi:hypothetical protein